jgi:murein DD-endopeptidase
MQLSSNIHQVVLGLSMLLVSLTWLVGCATISESKSEDQAKRQRILNAAQQLIGTPYMLGGESPQGVDCSGLVQYAYAQAGILLPRTASAQFKFGRSQSRILPGDLLFFRTSNADFVSHVGIYAGQNQMIHASSSSGKVSKVNLQQRYWQCHMIGGTTYLDNTASAHHIETDWPATTARTSS